MRWFSFGGIVFHTENRINSPAEHLQSLLKLFQIFKILVWYDDTIATKNDPYAIGIEYINRGKLLGAC